ncbi:MAG: endonuclease III domain-containing protein [Dehalococcoidales bacterium]|nr:endonuclease III domain-containing protein [Dehalococcoidales bacterium]
MENLKTGIILRDIYERLLERYGPQHWWPADEPFEVIVGAILTQNTAWTNADKAIRALKNAGVLSAPALHRIPEEKLAELIRPSGYFNVKARRLKAFVTWLAERCGGDLGKLFSTGTGSLREELLGVYGIGEETADSILLYAGGQPVFVIDAYTRRIFDRIGLQPDGRRYADYRAMFMNHLPPEPALYNEYHALIVRLGKEICRPRPLCRDCVLNQGNTSVKAYPCTVSSV